MFKFDLNIPTYAEWKTELDKMTKDQPEQAKKYQDKKQDQSHKNQAEINRPPVKTRLAKNANSNIISFEPKKSSIRKIKEV